MEQITINYAGGTVERRTLQGKEYLVAPISMISPGVLNGSMGPLYYPLDELKKDPSVWNGLPIVVNHPTKNGTPVSARDPDILDEYGIGLVLRTMVDNKLKAEGWFDIEALKRIDNTILTSLELGQAIELSTGVFTENENTPGEFNGVAYTAIARNYKPDHLAILPTQVGACSVQDGCGVLVNSANKPILDKFVEWLGITNKNEASHSQIREQLRSALPTDIMNDVFIDEVFDSFFVFSKGGQLTKQEFTKSKKGTVTIVGNPIPVFRKVTFVPTTNSEEPSMAKLTDDQRRALVDNMVTNCECWDEADRTVLNQFGDERLTSLSETVTKSNEKKAVENAAKEGAKELDPKPEPVANEVKPQTEDEWLAAAPQGVQSVVRNALALEAKQKEAAIAIITANSRNVFTKEQLIAKPINELQGLAALAQEAAPANTVPNYFGAAAPVDNSKSAEVDESDILPLPTINWVESAAN